MSIISHSQAGQDLFVNAILNGKQKGTFIEIGAYHPFDLSNSYALEQLGWKGFCIDINASLENVFKANRKCKFIGEDATKVDYKKLLSKTKSIDYISFDVDKYTIEVLKVFPLEQHPAAVITYEHDAYGHGNKDRNESRNIFDSLGYVRICSDVKHNGNAFEDWYYNPKLITPSQEFINRVTCTNKEYTEIIKSL